MCRTELVVRSSKQRKIAALQELTIGPRAIRLVLETRRYAEGDSSREMQ